MQKRGLTFLAAATVIVVALAGAALATGDHSVARAAPDQRALPALSAKLGDVGSVELRRSGFATRFVRDGERWLVAQNGNYPAAAGKVRQIVLALADLTMVEPKTREPALYPRLEVEDPGEGASPSSDKGSDSQGKSTLVTIKDKSGKAIAELIVGKRRYDRLGAGNDGVYIRKPGDPQSWLARGSLDLAGDRASWLDRRIVDLPDKKIAKVTLTQADGTILVLSRATSEAKFAIEGAPANAKPKSESATGEPAMALETLDLEDVKPAAQMPVPAGGVTTATYTTFAGLTVTLKLFEHDKKSWATVAAAGSGKAAADAKRIEQRVAGWVYAIPEYKAKMMETKLADLVEPAKGS